MEPMAEPGHTSGRSSRRTRAPSAASDGRRDTARSGLRMPPMDSKFSSFLISRAVGSG